ncbi:hypothetical protein MPEAHAMD_5227 [Methylobacterium frigidaeris]|uniref:Uncharacterized protein n=1 Tax=Methylobacterium frigidaeris TaxID=2038277 RepID=A0AA37HFF2_9HYPH|nr:hypothetical protein MPEAHAMD_5227 [Methylobacterium frigidaeris]
MSLGGKVRPKEQAAPLTPDTSAPHAGGRDEARIQGDAHEGDAHVGAQIRAHVRQVLQQAGSRASGEGN